MVSTDTIVILICSVVFSIVGGLVTLVAFFIARNQKQAEEQIEARFERDEEAIKALQFQAEQTIEERHRINDLLNNRFGAMDNRVQHIEERLSRRDERLADLEKQTPR